MNMKIYKTAEIKDEKLPDRESLGLYIIALKKCLKDNPQMNPEYADLINHLPNARLVRQEFSLSECKLLYETLEYLWSKITGQKLISEKEISHGPETLLGNYWMLANGITLWGVNHYVIIKNNPILFASLLDLGGMTLQEKLSSHPNKLLSYIINNGGLRLFVSKDKRLYAQCSPKTYGDWAKAKIQKLDFPYKIIKVVDPKIEYKGWCNGVIIKLRG